jgi:hypothetical protein
MSARGERVRQQWGAEEAWTKIRSTRAAPPGLTGGDEARTKTYHAAVQQFEQLLKTAESVGVESRPILLFYGLSQVGRAILAAREPNQWQVHGHGLKFVPSQAGDVFSTGVKSHGQGLFQAVASVLGETLPVRVVSLAELWAAMPGLPPIPETALERQPLRVTLDIPYSSSPLELREPSVLVGIPGAVSVQEASEALTPYLRTRVTVTSGWTMNNADLGSTDLISQLTLGQPRSFRLLPAQAAGHAADPMAALGAKTAFGSSWLLPKVGDSDNIGFLLLWWMALYVFSILARYEPNAWVGALDVNSSPVAVPLEGAFDTAQRQIPALVLRQLPN